MELEFGVLGFVEGGKLENPEKNPQINLKVKTNNKINLHNGTGQELNPDHIDGRQALSLLCNPCFLLLKCHTKQD